MTKKPVADAEIDAEPEYWKPTDVPPDLTQLERARICARNVRAWATWLLETGPAPERGDALIDVGEGKGEA